MSISQSHVAEPASRQRSAGERRMTPVLFPVIVESLKYWLPAAVAATILAALILLAVQQNMRLAANDPQIQIAEDTALGLVRGERPKALVANPPVDIAQSLAPFTIVFDEAGRPLASGAQLAGQIPVVPSSVFDYVRTHDEERITWQPQSGVRIAAVVTHYSGTQSGFVLAGRSLREVEKRENLLLVQVALAWIATLGASLCTAIGLTIITRLPRTGRAL